MSTKKDLVEAHAFSRRRLVTAFVSGAPGGREVEPTRSGRILVGGAALTVLMLAGAAIAGYLLGRPDSAWLDAGSFIISKDTGEQYVVLRDDEEPVIQRVPNYVSAQLLLGDPDLTPYTVRDKYIRDVRLGEDLGIDRAPSGLPAADDLIGSGWTACTADGAGVQVSVLAEPAVTELSGTAFLVTTGRDLWLVAGSPDLGGEMDGPAHRMRIAGDDSAVGTFVDALGFSAESEAARVSAQWLNLFPEAPALTPAAFGVRGDGPVRYAGAETDFGGLRVGDLVETSDGVAYLLGDEAPQKLSPFAATVYDAFGVRARQVEGDIRAGFESPEYPTQWPVEVPSATPAGDLCAVLEPQVDAAPRIALAHRADDGAGAEGIARGEHVTEVAPAGGAYVRAGSSLGATEGSPYVIDAKGDKYPLLGPDVATFLGYAEVTAPVVPNAWLDYFGDGVALSVNAARRVPEDAPPDEAAATGSGS